MAEESNNVIIGGLLALGGVFLGGILSFAIEVLRRMWSVSDRSYDRKKEIIDLRCAQADNYAQAVTEDFRHLMHDSEAYLENDDPYEFEQRQIARKSWKDHLDTKIFSLGPSIFALANDDLKQAWNHMMNEMDVLHQIYIQICEFKLYEHKPLDTEKTLGLISSSWLGFSRHLGEFYQAIDAIRNKIGIE